jgi:glyoxylase-like metal-dependent hydrolase (beta-lactamase superfamily II)
LVTKQPAFVRPPTATTVEALLEPLVRSAEEARAYDLGPGAWCLALPLPYPRLRSVNCYLLELDDGLCLVDCGSYLPPGWDALVHALDLAGRGPQDIQLLVCTHLHQDHAGLASLIHERTGCRLARAAGPKTAHDAFRDRGVPLAHRRELALREGVPAALLDPMCDAIVAGDGDHPRAHFHRELGDGDAIQTHCGTWQVVPLPGHSPAQIGLFEPERGWFISADLVFEGAIPYFEFGATSDPFSDHVASLDRALGLHAERLLPGHGRPVAGRDRVRDRLTAARTTALDLVTIALDTLQEGGCTAYELSLRLDRDDPHLDWRQSALSIAMCTLEHLLITGDAAASVGPDGVRTFSTGARSRAASTGTRRGVEPA